MFEIKIKTINRSNKNIIFNLDNINEKFNEAFIHIKNCNYVILKV